MKIMNRILLVLVLVAGCKKDDHPTPATGNDGSTINYVLNDNFSFGVDYAALNAVGLLDTLSKPGPYTVLAPDNNAFALIGAAYPVNPYSFQFWGPGLQKQFMQYTVLRGRISLTNMPLTTEQAYQTINGGSVYLKKYMDGTDTIVTVNGFKLVSADNVASNGLIQVIPQVLNPERYPSTGDYVHADTIISLFAAALQRAGLDTPLLSGNDPYTLLAPSNVAFQQTAKLGLGISTLDSILKADPLKLDTLLRYHIMKGRYFEGDLYQYAKTNPAGMTMLNNNQVIIGGNPTGFKAITFLGNGNQGITAGIAPPLTYSLSSNNANIPCGNGVVHIINRVLIP